MNMQNVNDDELEVQPTRTRKIAQPNVEVDQEELIRKTIATMSQDQIQRAQGVDPSIKSELMQNMEQSNSPNYWAINGLPSNYLLYPKGTQILGRPLKVLEVKKLSSINEENADFIINDILKRTIKGINIDNLLVADKLFIILWLRANTYRDSGYVVDYRCPKCSKDSKYHFEIDQLEVDHLTEDYDPNKSLKLRSGDQIKLGFLTISDEIIIDRFKEINRKSLGEIDNELLNLSKMILSINGEEKSLIEKYHFVLDMDPGDFSYITSYLEKFSMGIKPYVNVKCDDCGGTSPVGISFRSDFFVPSYKFE